MEGRFPRGLLGGLIALAALCALLAAGGASQAAWTSPGTGTTYTMLTLTASAGGDVDLVGAPPSCHFRIDSDITISNQDTLVIDAGCLIEFDNNEYLNIRGRLHLNGTAALPVSFIPTSGSSSPGLYGGLRFLGQAFAPSNVDNLTVRQAVNGVRCDGCRGLALHNLTGTALSGDLVQVVGGGSDVVVEDVRMVVSTFTSQTIVALQGAANVSGRNLSAPQAAVALLVWNATNVTFVGPIGATAASYGAAWVDNASGVSIEGLWGAGYPTGLRVTRSTNVAVTNATFAVPSLYGAFFQDAEGVALDELTVANASGAGLWLELVRNATVGGASLSATGLALAAVSVSNLTVTNLSARSAAGALWAVGAQGLLVDAASLTGGAGAGARIQGSAGVVLRAVAAANSSVGFRVEASADVRLEQCSATGGSDHGLEASSTVNLTVEACALSNNAGRGAYLRSVNGFRVLSVDADANAQDGFLLQDSNGSMGGVRARGNAKDGVRLTGASSLDGANLTVSGNTWGGVQLDTGSSANVARLVAAGNGANGTYVAAGAYLALTAARFEDNSAWGLRVEAGGAASWNVTAADEAVVSNPVVMAGAWAGRAGGALWVSNSTVSLRSAAGGVLVMDFSGGSQLALDRATLERADPTSRWALRLTGGAAFVAANSTLSHGGLTGSAPAVNATRSDLALADTLVMGFEGGLRLNASTALLVRVSFSGGSGGAIDARVGSSVAVADVRVEALASGPAVSLDGGAALTGARLNVSGAPAQGIVVAGGSSVDLDLLAAEGLAGCALCLSGGSSAFLRNGTVSTSGPGPAVGPGPAADVRLHDTQVTATAGAAVSVNASGFLILLASRLEAAGTAMAAGGGAWVIVRNSTIVSTAGEALAAQAASWVDVRDSTFDGALGGLRAQSVLFVEVHDSALTALVGAALRVASSGVVRVSGLNLTAGPGATGAAFDGNVFNASGLTVGGGDGSTGVLVANASGSVLSASSVKVGGGGAVGVASTATVGLVLREVAVVAGGSAEGIRVVGGSLWATNVSVSVGANATALRLDQASGSQLADVDVSSGGGGGSGILSVSTTGLTVARLRVSVGAGGVGVNLSAPLAGLLENLLVDGGRTGLASAGAGLTLRNATFLNQTGTALDVRDASSLEASDILASPAGIVLQNVSGARLQRLEVRGSTQGALRLLQTSGVTVADALLSPASGVGLDIFQSSQLSADGLRVLGGDTGVRFADAPGATVAGLVVDGAATSVLATGSTALTLEGPTLRGATAAALSATGAATLTVLRGAIEGASPSARHAAAGGSGLVRLYDTPADNATFEAVEAGAIEVYWAVTISATSGGSPALGVTVGLTDRALAPAGSVTTGAGGLAPPTTLLEVRLTAAGRAYSSPYLANASSGGGFAGSVAFDANRTRTVSVELVDIEPPSLVPRATERFSANESVDFVRRAGDRDNVAVVDGSYSWRFSNETGAPVDLSGPSPSYAFSRPGHYRVTVTAADAAGNSNSTAYEVWVNAAPYFTMLPTPLDLSGTVGAQLSFPVAAADPDPEDAGSLVITVQGLEGAAVAGSSVTWTPTARGAFWITLRVTDGVDVETASFQVLIEEPMGPSNGPPEFLTPPRLDANILSPYSYAIQVFDPEDDPVIVQLVAGTPGMALVQAPGSYNAELTWEPGLFFRRGAESFNFTFDIVLRASDGHTSAWQNFTILLRNPPDRPPEIAPIQLLPLRPGETVAIDLRQFASDPDDDVSTLVWSVEAAGETYGTSVYIDPLNPTQLIIRAPAAWPGDNSFVVTLVLTDTSGVSDRKAVQVQLEAPSAIETAFPWLLLITLIAAAGGAYMLATRQRPGMVPAEGAPARPATPPPAASAAAAEAVGSPLWLQSVALFDTADRLLHHVDEPGADAEATLVVVPSALKGASLAPGSLHVGRADDAEVAAVRIGEGVLVALGAFAGDPAPWLLEPMERALSRIQSLAAEAEKGSLDEVAETPAVHEALSEVLALGSASSAAAVAAYRKAAALRVASAAELVGGGVRLKVAVENGTDQLAADVRLSLDFDDKVMRLVGMDPAYESKRERVKLGNLRPGERKTVAFTFDPQVCARTFFNATAAFEDALGEFHSVAMKTRPVEVVCPAFTSAAKASTAVLKRLLRSELALRDAKYFRFPAEDSPQDVFARCKAAVSAHGLQLVREFEEGRPLKAEAWFYGETKVAGDHMVVWTTVHAADRVVQFTVASNAQPAITGLLAELGRQFTEGAVGGVVAVTGAAEQKEIAARASLLSKTEEGELGPDESASSE